MVRDIALLKVDTYWKNWSMAKIVHVFPDKNGVVRNAQLLFGSCNGKKQCWTGQYTKLFYLLRRRFDYPTKKLGQSKWLITWGEPYKKALRKRPLAKKYFAIDKLYMSPISGFEHVDVTYLIT